MQSLAPEQDPSGAAHPGVALQPAVMSPASKAELDVLLLPAIRDSASSASLTGKSCLHVGEAPGETPTFWGDFWLQATHRCQLVTPSSALQSAQLEMDRKIYLFHSIFSVISYLFNTGSVAHPITFLNDKGERA